MSRLVIVEFNELCPSLLSKWMQEGRLPNFAKFHGESEVFVTLADEPEGANLEPWIQWYTLHSGLPFSQHGVFHLTDGPRSSHPDMWSILQANGFSVWNCSSMNARRITGADALYLPDPWCDSQIPYPVEMQPYFNVVSRQVKEYSNRSSKLSLRDLKSFLWFMATHGLSVGTVWAIMRQLVGEKLRGAGAWRRAVLLDKLQFDVFRYFFKKKKPDFSTFFVNSTAHLQHSYWRHMMPDAFAVRPDQAEAKRYKDAILYGYEQMDGLLGKFMEMAGSGTTLIFATALSQQPYLKYESVGGHHFYRPRDVQQLLRRLNIVAERVEPVMTHQFIARFKSEADADDAKLRLAAVESGGEKVFGFDSADSMSVYFGCQLRSKLSPEIPLDLGNGEPPLKFFDLLYQIEGMKSGRHHPDGCLWIRRGLHRIVKDKVSILDVLPTVLDFFDLPATGYAGRSLFNSEQTVQAAE